MQIQTGDQRLANVDAFCPVDWIIIHGGKGALKAHSEYQLLLLELGEEKKHGIASYFQAQFRPNECF